MASPEQEIQDLLLQMNECLQKAKDIARENDLRFSFGEVHFSPLNEWKPRRSSTDELTVYIESDWYESFNC